MGIADDPAAQSALWWYIPAIVVLDYDGFYMYVSQTFTNAYGEELVEHRWTQKFLMPGMMAGQQHPVYIGFLRSGI